jgi:hypothetical protein
MVDQLMSKRLKAEARQPAGAAMLACERWNLPRGATRENDFALLSATGKPFWGNCGCRRKAIVADNSSDCPATSTTGRDCLRRLYGSRNGNGCDFVRHVRGKHGLFLL